MAYKHRFVDSDLTTVRLDLATSDISIIEEGSDIPLPNHLKQWSAGLNSDGKKYISGHYDSNQLTLAVRITGTDAADWYANIRAFIAEITRENILEVQPEGGSSIFIRTYPYDSANANMLFDYHVQLANMTLPFTVTLTTDPFWFGAEQTLTPVLNLVPNWNFSTYTGSGNTTDWTGWDETRVNGAGATTLEALAGAAFFGSVGAHFKITAADGDAHIWSTDYVTVDKTKHYCLVLNHYRVGGADSFNWNVAQYDSGNVAGTTLSACPAGAAAWRQEVIVIHPYTENTETYYWDADCAKVKIGFYLDTSIAEWYLDGCVFTCSEYLSGNTLTNALGVVIPKASLLGDVSTPFDIYLSKFDTLVQNTAGMYIGSRAKYDADFVARLENSLGTAALSALASGGAYMTQVLPGELVVDGDLETYTGSGNTTDWTNWVETRGANSWMGAEGNWTAYSGSGCLEMYSSLRDGLAKTASIISAAYVAVDRTKDHTYSLYRLLQQGTGLAKITMQILCYDVGSALLTTLTPIWTTANQTSWKQMSILVPANTMPVNTTKVKLQIAFQAGWTFGEPQDACNVDLISFQQSSSAISATVEDYLAHLAADAFPFLHYKISTAQASKTLTLQGKVKDDALGDITSLAEEETLSVSMLTTWLYQKFSRLGLPTAAFSDGADTSGLKQALEIDFDSSIAGGLTVSIDDLALIPSGEGMGYAEIPAESNRYLILDSQSANPGLLVSIDGTLDTAVRYSEPGALRRVFKLDPQVGLNLGALMEYRDSGGNAVGQWLADLSIKYRPRYLVVK